MPTARQGSPEEAHPAPLAPEPSAKPCDDNHAEEILKFSELEGLLLAGQIMARSRRFIGDDHREVVDYRILAETETITVTDWEHDGYFSIGQKVLLKIRCKIRVANGTPVLQYILDDRPKSNF